MNAVLAKTTVNNGNCSPSVRMAGITYSTNPHTVIRQLRRDGISHIACNVYIAIADRQFHQQGECLRSNDALAEELDTSKSSIKRAIRQLKKLGYLSVWYVHGNRRMRILLKGFEESKGSAVATQGVTSGRPKGHQWPPYKEDNIKKTTTTCDAFKGEYTNTFGEGLLGELATAFGVERVKRGLLVWDSQNKPKIDNPAGWLRDCIKKNYEPRKKREAKFSACSFDHEKIIKKFAGQSEANAAIVDQFVKNGVSNDRIAYKIWSKKI